MTRRNEEQRYIKLTGLFAKWDRDGEVIFMDGVDGRRGVRYVIRPTRDKGPSGRGPDFWLERTLYPDETLVSPKYRDEDVEHFEDEGQYYPEEQND